MSTLKSLVETTVRFVVLEPDAVEVQEARDRAGTIFNVRVAPNDVGRLIGKDGRVIGCVRQIVSAAAQKTRQRIGVKVLTD